MSVTTRDEIEGWLKGAKKSGISYVIVACDTFDSSDYPVFVTRNEDFWAEFKRISAQDMTQIHEVYDMSLPIDEQLNEHRAWHCAPRPGEPPFKPIEHAFEPDERGRCVHAVKMGDNGAPYYGPCGKMRALHAEAVQ